MTTKLKIRRQIHWADMTKILSILVIVACLGSQTKDHLFVYFENVLFPKSIHQLEYNVTAGDTLWSLACKTVQSGEDVRDKIIAIQKMNGLTPTQSLVPGQILRIPLKSPVDPGMRYTLLNE
ncbi:MAG: LysM peptidoglycan-binding domain-containing protein [Negativicutes bacterium]